ncbi:MAG: glycosyltransferase [Micropepsaceae bacterium]
MVRAGARARVTAPRLAIVVKGFPRLSETFIAREFLGLEARGISFSLHALRKPGGDAGLVDNKVATIPLYLPEYLHEAPGAVARAFAAARMLPGFGAAWRAFRADLREEFARARVRRFGQACVFAEQMPASVRHIHAHFAHSPASVARYAALMRGISFSISAHAKDIWTAPEWDLKRKLAGAAFVTVCNKAGYERLNAFGESAALKLIYHGLAHDVIVNAPRAQTRNGSDARDPVRIVTVARAVEKKGLRRLLDALALLPHELSWRLDHYGGGDLLAALKTKAAALGLDSRVAWHGPQPHRAVLQALDAGDLFVLPAVVGNDGDRDGIPNALLEAQARGLAVVASRVGGIDEAVTDGQSGRLAAPGDVEALRRILTELIRNPAARQALGVGALENVRRTGDAEAGYDAIAALLRERIGG